ncbi:resistance protein [Musa troglodytarum]|uniref:Resistance protein n=1 Tax=Musa troglodytarum TaxID=320322 RepID=A0A9E7FA37_9LILI|nr:resistance protein [Musa troglodytarum]
MAFDGDQARQSQEMRKATTARTLSLWLNNDKLLSSEFVGWQKLEGVRELEISGCEELRCFPPGIEHLEWLEIIRCNNLISQFLIGRKNTEFLLT